MSKYNPHFNTEPIHQAAEYWKKHALLSDGSVFTENSLWRLEYFNELDKYFINQLDAGEGNFFEKLEFQLDSTQPEVKQLAAEILWVMLLCPSNIGEEKKRENIKTIWDWSGVPYPDNSEYLKDEILIGMGSSGTSYNTSRWRELIYFIRMMINFKNLTQDERSRLLSDGWVFDEWLEAIPENETRQFRHMILFLLFPDNFERIFGGTDRRQAEVNAITQLLAEIRGGIRKSDATVTGFNIGINDGEDAGQTIFHCHVHLMPRRSGDVDNPRGGVRHIIPGKGFY